MSNRMSSMGRDGYPVRNDSRSAFEQVRSDSQVIDDLILTDLTEEQIESLRSLVDTIEADYPYRGYPVQIQGGLVMTPAIEAEEGELDLERVLQPNAENVSGTYRGLFLRSIDDGINARDSYRLFHGVETDTSNYYDFMGNIIHEAHMTYVTAADSSVRVAGVFKSHSFSELSHDGLTHEMDRLIIDESLSENKRFHAIAKMFTAEDLEKVTQHRYELDMQRVSYLNDIGYAEELIVLTPLIFYDLAEYPTRYSFVKTTPDIGYIPVNASNFEFGSLTTIEDEGVSIDGNSRVLYVRGSHEEFGNVLVPFHPSLYAIGKGELADAVKGE